MVFGLSSVVCDLSSHLVQICRGIRGNCRVNSPGEGRAHAASGSTRPVTILGATSRHLRYTATLSQLESFSSETPDRGDRRAERGLWSLCVGSRVT